MGNIHDVNLDTLHECGTCVKGEIYGVFNVSFGMELLRLVKYSISYGNKVKICDCYFSIDFKDFGLTTCPHKMYKTTFKVVNKDGIAVPNAVVKCDGGYTIDDCGYIIESNNSTYQTDENGSVYVYLKNGDYKVVATDGTDRAIRTITVNNKTMTKQLKLGDNIDLKNPIKIAYKWFGDAEIQPEDKGGIIKATYYENDILKVDCISKDEYIEEPYDLAYSEAWEYFKNNCEILIIGEGIEKVSGYREFQNLQELYLPNTLETICSDTFNSCSNLEIIHWPDKTIRIGQYAFYNCSKLKELTDVKADLSDYTFTNCTSLKEIDFTGWLGSKYVFKGCPNIEKVTINGSWNGSCYDAFSGCKLIKKIKINNTGDDGIRRGNASSGYLCLSPDIIIDLTDCEHPIELTDWDLYSFISQFSVSGATIKCREDSYEQVHKALIDFYMLNNNMEEEILSDGSKCIYPLKGKYPDVDLKIVFEPQLQTSLYSVQMKKFASNNVLNSSNSKNGTSYKDLIPGEEYLLCIMKNESLDNIFSNENILYIDQAAADEDGNIEFSYILDEENEGIIIKLYGKKKAETINFEKTQINLKLDETDEIKYSVTPKDVLTQEVEWLTSNENVVTVQDDGTIKAIGIGTATITIKIGEISATCKVIVSENSLPGDINGDGKVSLLDYGLVLAHVKRTKLLTGEQLQRADVNGDNKVSLLDYGLILAHVKRTKLLF